MKWLKGKKDELNQIELVNPVTEKYAIKLSVRPYTPTEEGYDCDVEYIEVIDCGLQSVDRIRRHLLDVLSEYDKSDEVNCFLFDGKRKWIDANTRNNIYHACELEEKKGKESYTLWVDNAPVTLPIATIEAFLTDLEEYAVTCYNKTSEHCAAINGLDKIEDILSYNISCGYPVPIIFNEQYL